MSKRNDSISLFLLFFWGFTLSIMPVMARPDIITVVSDISIQWSFDGSTDWQPAVACWIHPGWPTITGATYVWRTYYTDPADEYDNGPSGGWYYKKVFNIPNDAELGSLAGSIDIFADNAFRLFVNDVEIGGAGTMSRDGPDYIRSLKTYSLSGVLHLGDNVIIVRAINYLKDEEHNTYSSNPAGLAYKATISYNPFVIPELPFGAIMAIITSFAALGVFLKRKVGL